MIYTRTDTQYQVWSLRRWTYRFLLTVEKQYWVNGIKTYCSTSFFIPFVILNVHVIEYCLRLYVLAFFVEWSLFVLCTYYCECSGLLNTLFGVRWFQFYYKNRFNITTERILSSFLCPWLGLVSNQLWYTCIPDG